MTLTLAAGINAAGENYYRYIDENGVTVWDSRIPPKYVKNGYEVVTVSGRVLKVVPPAPSPEEAEALAAQRERQAKLAERDRYLQRRYSSVDDIEAARERKLADFDASMSILRGSISGIEARIERVQARAASAERAGRQVPGALLENLENLQAELITARQKVEQRMAEKKELEADFDRDIERFATIKSSPDD